MRGWCAAVAWLSMAVAPAHIAAQEEPAKPPPEAAPDKKDPAKPEIVVTASPLNPHDVHDTPYSANVTTRDDIQHRQLSGTLPRALGEMPNVNVQETGPSQGSPFIRGLTSYHTVMMIDGIRLNHTGMRSGPNQYWGTVDPFLFDRLELVRGPSSVLYGSDSIGGTVSAYTIEPAFEEDAGCHGRAYYRYESARQAHVARQELSGNAGDFGWLVGGSYKDWNEIVGGRHVGLMRGTDYDEYDADLKLVYRLGGEAKLVLATQHHRMDDGERWHSTANNPGWHGTSPGSDITRKFDQERNLTYLQLHWNPEGGIVDAFKGSLSWHRQAEQTRRIRSSGAIQDREFVIDTPAVWVQAGKQTDWGYFTGGVEFYHEIVGSDGHDWNPGYVSLTRGIIADDATYDTIAVYLQDEIAIGDLDVTPGIRFTHIAFDANEVDPAPAGSSIVDSVDDSFSAVTGSLRLLYHVTEEWNAIAGWGMGFRAPSLNDITAVDLVLSGGNDLPSPGLDPEYAHTFDLGFRARYPRWEVSAFAFYTLLDDWIARVDAGGGNYTRDNVSDGWIYGYEVMALYRITDEIMPFFNWGYAKGRIDRVAGGDEPLSKMNPSLGHLGIRYEPLETGVWVEGLMTFADEQKHQSAADVADTQRQPPGGTPGYTVYTLRGGYRVNDHVTVSAAVENITNKDYRIHGSGQNMPGTNVILALDVRY